MKIKTLILAMIMALAIVPLMAEAQTNLPSGTLNVNPVYRATYSVSGVAVTPAATTTDFVLIKGSATKTIQIKKVVVSGNAVAGTAGSMDVALVKRTTLDYNNAACTASIVPYACCSGAGAGTCAGVYTVPTILKYDSADPTPSAVPWLFSTNPQTLGTSAGIVEDRVLNFGLSGAAGQVVFDFSTRNDKPIRLHGISEWLAINLNGGAVPSGGVVSYTIEFEEF